MSGLKHFIFTFLEAFVQLSDLFFFLSPASQISPGTCRHLAEQQVADDRVRVTPTELRVEEPGAAAALRRL